MTRKLPSGWIRNTGQELIRAGMVSVLALSVDLGLLLLLANVFHQHYLLAASTGFVAGLAINYILSTKWVFRSRRGVPSHIEFMIFSAVGFVGLGLTDLLMFVFVSWLHIPLAISKICTAGVVFCWNFTARKLLLFTREI
jgi:putative flippase GtrA